MAHLKIIFEFSSFVFVSHGFMVDSDVFSEKSFSFNVTNNPITIRKVSLLDVGISTVIMDVTTS